MLADAGSVASSAHVPSSIQLMPFQTFTARLVRSVALSELTKHLEFEMKGVPRFGFVAGQWLSFKTNKPDGEEIIRAYSIASPPDGRQQVRPMPEPGAGRFHVQLSLRHEGRRRDRTARDHSAISFCARPCAIRFSSPPAPGLLLFVPCCTGFWFQSRVDARRARTPVLHRARQGHQLWLIFGNRTEKDIYYHDEFLRLAKEHANFHYLPTLSRGGPEWQGLRGYVQEHVPADRSGPNRHARLHLRPGQDGQSQPRSAEVAGLGPEVDSV